MRGLPEVKQSYGGGRYATGFSPQGGQSLGHDDFEVEEQVTFMGPFS